MTERPSGIGTLYHFAERHGRPRAKRKEVAGSPAGGLIVRTMASAAAADPPRWQVHNLIVEATVALLVAPPGDGKTHIALRLAHCVATGTPFAGREVRRGCVFYLAGEDVGSVQRRLKALALDGDAPDFHLVTAATGVLDLRSRNAPDATELLDLCKARKPALVVIDTLAAVTPGMDENDGAAVGAAFAVFSEIAASTGAAVLVLHHPRKGGTDARGHGASVATAATVLSVEKAGTALLLTTTKSRDADGQQRLGFEIEVRRIGTDEQGRPVHAAVAVAADLPPPAAMGQQGEVLALLRELIAEIGQPEVLVKLWSARCKQKLWPDTKGSAGRTAFGRAKAALLEKGLIAVRGDSVTTRTEADADVVFEPEEAADDLV